MVGMENETSHTLEVDYGDAGRPRSRQTVRTGLPNSLFHKTSFSYQLKNCCYWLRINRWADFFFPVNLSNLWGRHLVWAKSKDGDDLLRIVNSHFATTSIFTSLLVNAELSVLFSPSPIMIELRQDLEYFNTEKPLRFATGFILCFNLVCTLLALFANLFGWTLFSVPSKENAAIVIRSSIGLYTRQVSTIMVFIAVYTFILWIGLFFCVLIGPSWKGSLFMCFILFSMVIIISSTYSALGNVIMHTSAMSSERIMPKDLEDQMDPHQLTNALLYKTKLSKEMKIPVNEQYRMDYQEALRQRHTASREVSGDAQV